MNKRTTLGCRNRLQDNMMLLQKRQNVLKSVCSVIWTLGCHAQQSSENMVINHLSQCWEERRLFGETRLLLFWNREECLSSLIFTPEWKSFPYTAVRYSQAIFLCLFYWEREKQSWLPVWVGTLWLYSNGGVYFIFLLYHPSKIHSVYIFLWLSLNGFFFFCFPQFNSATSDNIFGAHSFPII